jgi:alcohol dehydrogenase class IV
MNLSVFMGKIYSFQLPKKIIFGTGSSSTVGLEAKALGGNRVLLITDDNLRSSDLMKNVEENLLSEGLSIDFFSDIRSEPSLEVAEKVAEKARGGGYDLIVGVGGGSVLDMAKVASIAATNKKSMRQYLGVNLVEKPGLPKILMPTTAGTGSEVTHVAVITLLDEEAKSAIVSPYLFSDVSIIDPRLTYSMPPRVTASTGLDALSHAFEALMAVNANPITDALALQSIGIIFKYLPRAYVSGDEESRFSMSLGALMAGMAFINSWVCLGHALAYSFSVKFGVPHGLSCGLSLPYAFKFNAPAIRRKLPQIAEKIDVNYREKISSPDDLEIFIFNRIMRLLDELNAPKRLREIGVSENDLAKIASKVLTFTRLIEKNSRPISEDDARRIVMDMW